MNAVAAPAKILIVEDEGIIAAHLESRLAKTGYQVVGIADSSDEALAKVAELTPDLVLMDIRINGPRDGVETAEALRMRFALPVIYLTSHSDRETIERAKRTGPAGFLTKPVHHLALANSIEMALFRQQADREIDRQRSWIETVLAVMEEPVAVLDAEGWVRHVNSAAEKLTGWSAAEARGRDLATLLQIEEGGEVLLPPQTPQAPRCLPRGLMARNRAGKQFPLGGMLFPSAGTASAPGAVLVFHDAAVLRAEAEAERETACLRAVGLFARGAAHDFNNLLTVILGCAHLARSDGRGDSVRERALDRIEEAAAHAGEIAQQLMQFSAREPLEIGRVDLNETIRETEALLRCAAGSGVEWRFELSPRLKPVMASKGRLRQILMNLAVNAREAMEDAGSICVETANVGDAVQLTIEDTGSGMSEETAARLFEPCFSTRGVGKGRGIGLSLVQGIVEEYGGTIRVESRPDQGTRFIVRIPAETTALAIPPESRSSQQDRPTVLLLEKEPLVRDLLSLYLGSWDCNLLTASSAEDALRLAEENPALDLLIADLGSRNRGGLTAAVQLARECPRMRTLFLAGFDDEPGNFRDEAPGSKLLRHPFTRTDFLNSVEEFLKRES